MLFIHMGQENDAGLLLLIKICICDSHLSANTQLTFQIVINQVKSDHRYND